MARASASERTSQALPGASPTSCLSRSRCSATPAGNPSKRIATSKSCPRRIAATAAGSSCAPRIADTSSLTPRAVLPRARRVMSESGSGCSRKVAVATRPSVPSDPTIIFGRSKPATFLTTFPPPFAGTPSARTRETPMMRSRRDPYRVRRAPKPFVARRPPIVCRSGSGGSRARRCRCAATARCSSARVMPASTTMIWSEGACSTMRVRCSVRRTASSRRGGRPRESAVPPPTNPTRALARAFSSRKTAASSTVEGEKTSFGRTPRIASALVPARTPA